VRDVDVQRRDGEAVDVHFVQIFESGSYHDEGAKVLTLRKRSDGLRILLEEMLSSVAPAGATVSATLAPVHADTPGDVPRGLTCCLLSKGTCAPLPQWEKVDPLTLPLRAPGIEALRCEMEIPTTRAGQAVGAVELNVYGDAGPQALGSLTCPCPPRVELTVPAAKVREVLKLAPVNPIRLWAIASTEHAGRLLASWHMSTYKEAILGRMPSLTGRESAATLIDRPRPPINPTDFAPLVRGTLTFWSDIDGFAGGVDGIEVSRKGDGFELSRRLRWDQLPPDLAVWKGKAVKVFDDRGRTCDAVVDEPLIEAMGYGPNSLGRKTDAQIIQHFQPTFSHMKLSWRVHLSTRPPPSIGGCVSDRFVRAVDRPAARVIVASEASKPLRAAAIASLRRSRLYRGLLDNRDSMRARGEDLASPHFVVFDSGADNDPAVHLLSLTYPGGDDGCGLWALWEVRGTPQRPELRLLNDVDGHDVVEPVLAVDLNGDGDVELVDDRGGFIQHDIGPRYIPRKREPVDRSICYAVEGD
jgi:hypothetical protein